MILRWDKVLALRGCRYTYVTTVCTSSVLLLQYYNLLRTSIRCYDVEQSKICGAHIIVALHSQLAGGRPVRF